MSLNKELAREFLEFLDPTTKTFTLQAIFDKKDVNKASRAKVGTLDELWPWIEEKQNEGYGIFVTAQIMDGKGRKLENVRGVRCVFQEDDNDWQGEFPLEPSLVVQTSPGKYHRYWLLDGPSEDFDAYKSVMQVMVEEYGSDRNAKDLCRVMRLPGTHHMKEWNGGRGGVYEVEVIDQWGIKYSMSELVKAFRVDVERPERGQQEAAEWALKRPIESLKGREDILTRLLRRWGMDDRDSWLRAGMILHHQYEGGAEGLVLWDKISAEFDNYTEDGCAVAWESFSEVRTSDDTLTARSLIEAGKVDVDAVLEEIEDRGEDVSVKGVVWDIEYLDEVDREKCRRALMKAANTSKRLINKLGRDLREAQAAERKVDHRVMALMVIAEHGADLLNVGGQLYQYNGRYWERLDERGRVLLVRDIVSAIPKVRIDDALYKKVGNMVVAELDRGVDGGTWKWNQIDRNAVALLNGVVEPGEDGRGVLRPHNKTDYLDRILERKWRPGLVDGGSGDDGEVWIEDRFMGEVMDGDADRVRLLWEMIGYCFMSHTDQEKFFILLGNGKNGKSVLLYMIEKMIGEDRCCSVSPRDMKDQHYAVRILDSYVNLVPEISKGEALSDGDLKAITSGDPIRARVIYEKPYEGRPMCTMIMGTNHLPYNRDTSDGLLRRMVVIPFEWRPEKVDVGLRVKMSKGEVLDRGLVKALRAYWRMLLDVGDGGEWVLPGACVEAAGEWQDEVDPFRVWFRDNVTVTGRIRIKGRRGASDEILLKDAHERYCEWHDEEIGYGGRKPLSKQQFAGRLKRKKGVKIDRGNYHKMTVSGIKIKGEENLN